MEQDLCCQQGFALRKRLLSQSFVQREEAYFVLVFVFFSAFHLLSGRHKFSCDWSPMVLTLKQGQRFLFSHVPNEVALPLCGPARPETQAGEDGGTLNCTGASLGSRTRLCLPGKLREFEAVGAEVPAAPQRGRFVQGSQPGPALMLGPAAHSARADRARAESLIH